MTSLHLIVGTYADEVEADLAFRGIDLRDYWLPGGGPSRLTMRRLVRLLKALPYDSALQGALRAATAKAKAELLPSRRNHYARKKAEQEARQHGS